MIKELGIAPGSFTSEEGAKVIHLENARQKCITRNFRFLR